MAENRQCESSGTFYEDCPYFFNGTHEGKCERDIVMCEKYAKERKKR